MKNNRLKRFILNGGIILYPTESCFGIGCDPSNFFSIKKIMKIKKRNSQKNFLIIASELIQFKKYIRTLAAKEIIELNLKWPGAHTWVVDIKKNCPSWLASKNETIAIRIPSFSFCMDLTKSINMAIISSSANISGKRSIKNYREACRFSNSQIKLIKGLTDGQKKPSTIQDFKTKKILRK